PLQAGPQLDGEGELIRRVFPRSGQVAFEVATGRLRRFTRLELEQARIARIGGVVLGCERRGVEWVQGSDVGRDGNTQGAARLGLAGCVLGRGEDATRGSWASAALAVAIAAAATGCEEGRCGATTGDGERPAAVEALAYKGLPVVVAHLRR